MKSVRPAVVFNEARGYTATQDTPSNVKRNIRGRPYSGHLMFTQAQLSKVPDFVRVRQLSRLLGMAQSSVQFWMGIDIDKSDGRKDGLRLRFHRDKLKRPVVKKADLIEFLRESGRFEG